MKPTLKAIKDDDKLRLAFGISEEEGEVIKDKVIKAMKEANTYTEALKMAWGDEENEGKILFTTLLVGQLIGMGT